MEVWKSALLVKRCKTLISTLGRNGALIQMLVEVLHVPEAAFIVMGLHIRNARIMDLRSILMGCLEGSNDR